VLLVIYSPVLLYQTSIRINSNKEYNPYILTWNMILFEAKYHLKKTIFIGTIFLWNVFLFGVFWFTYSSDRMSTLEKTNWVY
jgi:hypothetical protein